MHVILENGLGYKYGTSGEGKDVVESTLQSAVALFKFAHEHCDLLIRNKRTRFGSPHLRGIRESIFTKVKRSRKKVELNKEILAAKIKYVREHIIDWLSSYQRRNNPDEPRAGEAILRELDSADNILGNHLGRLHDADEHNKENIKRKSG